MDQSELDILFPEIEVEGVRLRPWSLGQVVDLAPVFTALSKGMKENGITLTNIESRMDDFVLLVMPYMARIIAVSARLPEEEVRAWPLNKATMIAMSILSQNVEHLKNSFGLGRGLARELNPT
jgi:hypothetical protein